MPDIQITHNGVFIVLPASARDLAARRIELELMTDYDPEIYPAFLDALADDYEQVYPGSLIAEKLRKRATQCRAEGAF
jgi:hypothetical protein